MSVAGNVIKKEWRLIAFILLLILIFCLLWIFRSILLPYILGFLFAYMMLPVVRFIEKHLPFLTRKHRMQKLLRTIIILLAYVLFLALLGIVIFSVISIISNSLSTLSIDTSTIIPNGLDTIKNWLTSLPFFSTPAMQATLDEYFQQANSQLPTLLINFLSSGWKILTTSLNTIAGFIILPVFTFYLVYDWEILRDKFFRGQSIWLRKHTMNVFNILYDVIIRYVRGQLFLGVIVGFCTWIMLVCLRVEYALPLAIFSAVTELVPMIGPWIGGGLGVLATLAIDPHKALWVGIGYIVIQLLENQFLVPKIQGKQMELHPALVILLSFLGAYFAGILGFIIILPVTMLFIKLYRYFTECFRASQLPEVIPDEEYFPPEE